MDSPCIKQTVCKVLKIFQYGKYLVAYVLKEELAIKMAREKFLRNAIFFHGKDSSFNPRIIRKNGFLIGQVSI